MNPFQFFAYSYYELFRNCVLMNFYILCFVLKTSIPKRIHCSITFRKNYLIIFILLRGSLQLLYQTRLFFKNESLHFGRSQMKYSFCKHSIFNFFGQFLEHFVELIRMGFCNRGWKKNLNNFGSIGKVD